MTEDMEGVMPLDQLEQYKFPSINASLYSFNEMQRQGFVNGFTAGGMANFSLFAENYTQNDFSLGLIASNQVYNLFGIDSGKVLLINPQHRTTIVEAFRDESSVGIRLHNLDLNGKNLEEVKLRENRLVGNIEPERAICADVIFTEDVEIPIVLKPADCIGAQFIAIDTEGRKVVGIVHAGREGIKNHIVIKTLDALKSKFGNSEFSITFTIPPYINPKNYIMKYIPGKEGKEGFSTIDNYDRTAWGEENFQWNEKAQGYECDIFKGFEAQVRNFPNLEAKIFRVAEHTDDLFHDKKAHSFQEEVNEHIQPKNTGRNLVFAMLKKVNS